MMKELIKKSLILAALVTLSVFTFTAILHGNWSDTYFLWELFILSGLICIIQLLMSRFKSNYYLLEVLAEYFMVLIVVGLSGLIFGWFRPQYLWQVLVYVTPVYVVGYFLDLGRTRREVDMINEKIKQRSERGIVDVESDDNG